MVPNCHSRYCDQPHCIPPVYQEALFCREEKELAEDEEYKHGFRVRKICPRRDGR